MVLAALRWLVLLAVHAPCCFLMELFAGRKASHEVLWHAPLLYIYQVGCLCVYQVSLLGVSIQLVHCTL
jgi:hypothetical protein